MKDKREKRKNRMKALRQAVNMELKEHRSTFIVFSIPVSYTHLDVYKRQINTQEPDISAVLWPWTKV